MIEVIGYIGAIAFTICGLPLAYAAYRTHDTRALTWFFLHAWNVGNTCMLVYSIHLMAIPLILDYTLNAGVIAYIYYVKWKYK